MRVKLVMVVAVIAVLATACQVDSSGGSSSGETKGKVLQHSGDVKITACKPDRFGNIDARVKITNHSSKASDYLVTIAFESKNGKTQIDTGTAIVNSLQPGQSTNQDAGGTKTYKKPYKCTLSDATRTASD